MKQENEEMVFADFALATPILNAIKKAGFTQPTPIQQRVIPLVLEGRDVVGQAHTGTGKTAAFGLPALNYVKNHPKAQVLVLSPVRELAAQIAEEIYRFSGEGGVQMTLIHGGKAFARQIESVRHGAQIVVATPGRLLDLLSSNKLPSFKPAMVVIDEADEMLDKGFLDDIKEILTHLPKERQTLLFSATMPEPIRHLAKSFLNNPCFVQIESKEKTNENIQQFYCLLEGEEREDGLVRLLDTEHMTKAIIFCNTKKEVDHLSAELIQRKYPALSLHGDMEQPQRQKVMGAFRKSRQGILVATEVAARGLNVEDVSHVFNYELPFGAESYVHRIGRTGRAGKLGKAISFVTPREFYPFERICKTINVSVQYLPIPDLSKAQEKRHGLLLQQLKEVATDSHAEEILQLFQKELEVEEIALRLVKLVLKEEMATGPEKIGIDIKTWKRKDTRESSSKSFRGRGNSRGRGFPSRGGRSSQEGSSRRRPRSF
jgi:ATP-dependent RNA helicase DeaD